MAIDIAGTILNGGTSVIANDTGGNKIFTQTSGGQVLAATDSSGNSLTPLFNVGYNNTSTWTDMGSANWVTLPFTYTGGGGYYNVGNCYNTSTYRFTAPWTGMYLFSSSTYLYCVNGNYTNYVHTMFWVNGGSNTRRPGGTLYRMRQYGFYGSYQHDGDICEPIYLTAGDYVDVRYYFNVTLQIYGNYGFFSGAFLGS